MAIIFMNLLVGLTVDSIEILKEKSTIIMDVKRIEDIKLGLKFLPRIFRPTKITTMIGKSKTKKVNVLIEVEYLFKRLKTYLLSKQQKYFSL